MTADYKVELSCRSGVLLPEDPLWSELPSSGPSSTGGGLSFSAFAL